MSEKIAKLVNAILENAFDNLVCIDIDLEDNQCKRISAVWEFEEEVKEE